MTETNLGNVKNVYFIGIGGISMSGLAMILQNRGIGVCGSDSKGGDITEELIKRGITVYIGQCRENIRDNIDMAVYTAAISEDNEEFLEIKKRGIPLIPRSKLLGLIMDKFKGSVAVAGTHGKTTTTSMISQILMDAGLDPTISIGGIIPSIESNTRIGGSDYFVAEACEYTNSFLELYPLVSVVLNIELDHIDYFKNMDEINSSFRGFVSNVKKGGAVIINADIDGYEDILPPDKSIITYGLKNNADWTVKNIDSGKESTKFELIYKGELIGKTFIALPGEHNVSNTLAACAAAHFLGVPKAALLEYVKNFSGARRRFEFKGTRNGFTIIDDYAHHPSEIRATLKAARSRYEDSHIWCVFQPHTYSRTKAFLEEFSESFDDADTVILADIYAAREKNTGDISSEMLMKKIKEHGKSAVYIADFKGIEEYLTEHCTAGDLVLTMGAGDVHVIGESLSEK